METKLLMAQAELEERRHAIAEECGRETIEQLNQQAVEAEIESSAVEHRLDVIKNQLERLREKEIGKLIEEYGEISRLLEAARRRSEIALEKVEDMKFNNRSTHAYSPRVKIIRIGKFTKARSN